MNIIIKMIKYINNNNYKIIKITNQACSSKSPTCSLAMVNIDVTGSNVTKDDEYIPSSCDVVVLENDVLIKCLPEVEDYQYKVMVYQNFQNLQFIFFD